MLGDTEEGVTFQGKAALRRRGWIRPGRMESPQVGKKREEDVRENGASGETVAVLGTTVIATWATSPDGSPVVFRGQLSSLGLDGALVCGSGALGAPCVGRVWLETTSPWRVHFQG